MQKYFGVSNNIWIWDHGFSCNLELIYDYPGQIEKLIILEENQFHLLPLDFIIQINKISMTLLKKHWSFNQIKFKFNYLFINY